MKSEINENSITTYVLFGKEAVMLYKTSINALMDANDVKYKVDAYNSVKKFVNDTREWDDFIEISKEEFLILSKYLSTRKIPLKSKKGCLSKLFKL